MSRQGGYGQERIARSERLDIMKNTQQTNTCKEKPKQRFAFLDYDEDDLLNWDVAITPPPRRSGTIRVRLVYKGRRKPMLVEDPWEE